MPDDLRTSLVAGTRMLAGWACAAVGVLDLSMGVGTAASPTDGPYLLFHVVVLAGGLLLLGLGKLPKSPAPIGYAVTAALAVVVSVLAALPSTRDVCCLTTFAVRHGFPLTLLAWDTGQARHFAPAHAVADLVFWFLAGMLLLALITQVLPRRQPPPDYAPAQITEPAQITQPAQAAGATQAAQPGQAEDQSTHAEERATAGAEERAAAQAEERAAAGAEPAPVADDESVGGLP
jgi:hypothetical protein